MSTFRNNLTKGDAVIHAENKRPGKVTRQPRETSRFVGVVWQGINTVRSVDVMKLRLIINGVPEEVPPVEGTPPEMPVKRFEMDTMTYLKRPGGEMPASTALEALTKERDHVADEMTICERRFKDLRAVKERLDQAIAILAPQREVAKIEVPRMGVA